MPSQAQKRPIFGLRCEIRGEIFEWVLQPGLTTIGTRAANDIVIDSAEVSRHHAELSWEDGVFSIEDVGSTNGTYVNGLRVRKAELKAGDSICFGSVLSFLQEMDVEDSTPAITVFQEVGDPSNTPVTKNITTIDTSRKIPASWLGVFRRLVELRQRDSCDSSAAMLDLLRVTLGARALILLRAGEAGESTVEGVAGDCPDGVFLERLATRIEGAAAEEPKNPSPRSLLLDGFPGVTVAVMTPQDHAALALAAADPSTKTLLAVRLLEESLELLASPVVGRSPKQSPRVKGSPELIFPPGHVLGKSPVMLDLYRQLRHLINGDLPLLIMGETGVGKEAVARAIYLSSKRRTGPFVAVNCASIPSDLLEAELFGIEKGVATGVEAREGKITQARGGVLFLDEVSEMSPPLQAKLLRALQENEIYPLGARTPIALDSRVVSATNTELSERMDQGLFRRDVYYRLAGCTVEVPPLRKRPGDIPALVQHFLQRAEIELEKQTAGISVRALRALIAGSWPGNIRELEHEVRRLVYLATEGRLITSKLLGPRLQLLSNSFEHAVGENVSGVSLAARVQALERDLIERALAESGGNRTRAAKLLGISRYGLHLKLKRFALKDQGDDTSAPTEDG